MTFLFLCISLAVGLMITSQVTARELAETSTSVENSKTDETINGLGEAKYPGGGYGGYPGGGYGGYPGGGYGGYPGGGYGGCGGYGGGGRGGYGGGYCGFGCCSRSYYGGSCRCCSYPGLAVDVEP